MSETGHLYFVDHVNETTTYTDPRLAFALEEKKTKEGSSYTCSKSRVLFDASTTASQILLARDLTGHVAIVTGECGEILLRVSIRMFMRMSVRMSVRV